MNIATQLFKRLCNAVIKLLSKKSTRLITVIAGLLASNYFTAFIARRYFEKKLAKYKKALMIIDTQYKELQERISAGIKPNEEEQLQFNKLKKDKMSAIAETEKIKSMGILP